jgi:hypothetical protein
MVMNRMKKGKLGMVQLMRCTPYSTFAERES